VCRNIIDDRLIKDYQQKLEKAYIKLRRKKKELEAKNIEFQNKIEELATQENKTIALIEAAENGREVSKVEIGLLAREYKKIGAKKFVTSYPTDLMLQNDKLEAIDEKLDIIINRLADDCTINDVKEIGNTFRLQGNIIDTIPEFSNIGYGLINLADAIQNLKEEDISRLVQYKDILFTISESMFNWRETIFVNKSTDSIHYLDNALISDCIQVEALLSGQEIEGEDLELF